jgi:hypothetical protein
MQCPRCGLQNSPGAARCMRCSHLFEAPADQPTTPRQDQPSVPAPERSGGRPEMPARWRDRQDGDTPTRGEGEPPSRSRPRPAPAQQRAGWQHPGYAPKPPPPPPPPPEPEYGSIWRILAAVALVIAAVACFGYGGWAMIARRGIFADLADGRSVTAEAARESDRLNDLLLGLAVGAVVVAVALWLVAHLRRRKPFGTAGFTAAALIVTGALVLVGGAYMTSLVDGEVSRAATAAIGFLIMGGGSILLGAGVVSALVAVFVRPARPEVLSAGFAGWDG